MGARRNVADKRATKLLLKLEEKNKLEEKKNSEEELDNENGKV